MAISLWLSNRGAGAQMTNVPPVGRSMRTKQWFY
jgi:hypothetical protein